MTEVVEQLRAGATPAVLSGPTFGERRRAPATATARRCRRSASGKTLAKAIGSATSALPLRTEHSRRSSWRHSQDVLAIAASIVTGRGSARRRSRP